MLVLAYGSNLDPAQMTGRCPSAEVVGRATLPHHALTFGGHSQRWGGGVASLVRARGGLVVGVVFKVSRRDVAKLDRFEGVPFSYERVRRWVVDEHGSRHRVHLYLQPLHRLVRGKPGPRYLAALWQAYTLWDFDRKLLMRAAGEVR